MISWPGVIAAVATGAGLAAGGSAATGAGGWGGAVATGSDLAATGAAAWGAASAWAEGSTGFLQVGQVQHEQHPKPRPNPRPASLHFCKKAMM